MTRSEIPVRRVGVAQARRQFSSLLDEVFRGDARVIVEKSGIPVAAIVPANELDDPASDMTLPDLDELRRLLYDVDAVLRAVPRDERRAVLEQAVDHARQARGDRKPAPGSLSEFYEQMMERDDVRRLLTHLAEH